MDVLQALTQGSRDVVTYGEFALLRVLREGSDLAHIPVEIIKFIIGKLNWRGRVAYRRRKYRYRFMQQRPFHAIYLGPGH
jgi:hypothetical protein